MVVRSILLKKISSSQNVFSVTNQAASYLWSLFHKLFWAPNITLNCFFQHLNISGAKKFSWQGKIKKMLLWTYLHICYRKMNVVFAQILLMNHRFQKPSWCVGKLCNFCKMVTQAFNFLNLRWFVAHDPLNEFAFRFQICYIFMDELNVMFYRYR